jgi:hypothetical protein
MERSKRRDKLTVSRAPRWPTPKAARGRTLLIVDGLGFDLRSDLLLSIP